MDIGHITLATHKLNAFSSEVEYRVKAAASCNCPWIFSARNKIGVIYPIEGEEQVLCEQTVLLLMGLIVPFRAPRAHYLILIEVNKVKKNTL